MSTRLSRPPVAALYLGLAALCVLPALGMDANATTARYAHNLLAGRGLVFYSPAPAITTTPLIPIAFALNGHDSLWMAWAISTLAAAAGGLILARLVGKGWWVGVAYILVAGLSPSAVTLSVIALGLAATLAVVSKRWLMAGILIALAVLTDPLAVILLLLLVLYGVQAGDLRWRFLVPAIANPALILGAQVIALGSPGNVIVAAPQSEMVVIALPALAILALVRSRNSLRENPHLALLVAWSGIGGAVSMIGHGWPGAVILPGMIILLALWARKSPHPESLPQSGGRDFQDADLAAPQNSPQIANAVTDSPSPLVGEGGRGWGVIVILALAVDLVLNLVIPSSPLASSLLGRQSPTEQIGAWITAHTDANSTVAVANSHVLPLDLDRPVLELPGNLDGTFFIRYAPGALVLPPAMSVAWPGFPTTYTRATTIGDATI